ncbi:hypothetical protein J8J27_34500, partial [Mycobacterium tuberculosis]|nr:hypothetical protein [Mycobacterium tuberculosis]
IILQKKLGTTVIPYGSPRQQAEVAGKLKSVAAAPAPAASDMASYNMRAKAPAGRKVVTGEGDLVNDVQAGRAKVEALK